MLRWAGCSATLRLLLVKLGALRDHRWRGARGRAIAGEALIETIEGVQGVEAEVVKGAEPTIPMAEAKVAGSA